MNPSSGPTGNKSSFDFQSPYLIKLLSSAPLSDNITYYFYGIFAEKGGNGEALIEDAWFRHDDAFGTGVAAQLGQFQLSDLMFPRETRMTFQDFMVYRMAGVTYDRGLLFSHVCSRSEATSISLSKCPMLHTIALFFIRFMCSWVMTWKLPVADTKMSALSAAYSMVTTR